MASPKNGKAAFSPTLFVRIVNGGTSDEFLLVGPTPSDVDDSTVGPADTVSERTARYVLAGVGEVRHTAPAYVEEA